MANKKKNIRSHHEDDAKRTATTPVATETPTNAEQLDLKPNEGLLNIFFPKDSSIQSRLLDIFNYYLLANILALVIYGALTGFAPNNAFLASTFGLMGLVCVSLALKSHLKHGNSLYPGIDKCRAYFEFILAGVCALLGAFTFLG